MAQRHPTIEAAFWAKVDKRGADDCWPWLGTKCVKGYGSFEYGGQRHRATRQSWSIANQKPFPANLQACHTCDNPPCVNPAHLWAGTSSENLRDSFAKGRRYQLIAGRNCVNGHLLTEANLGIIPGRNQPFCRDCRKVQRLNSKRRNPKPRKERTQRKQQSSGPYGRGKLCRVCGHLRTDDYFYSNRNGTTVSQCRQCNHNRVKLRRKSIG